MKNVFKNHLGIHVSSNFEWLVHWTTPLILFIHCLFTQESSVSQFRKKKCFLFTTRSSNQIWLFIFFIPHLWSVWIPGVQSALHSAYQLFFKFYSSLLFILQEKKEKTKHKKNKTIFLLSWCWFESFHYCVVIFQTVNRYEYTQKNEKCMQKM